MAENTKIEWATHTWNPWMGCTKASPGCDRCYAEALMDHRYGKVQWGPHGERVRTSEANWKKPRQWARKARAGAEAWRNTESATVNGRTFSAPQRPRVFCASLGDVFDNQVPAAWRDDLFQLIHDTPELDWLLLTKRPENIRKLGCMPTLPWSNIWLGFTAEDQTHFDRRWPIVREIPARVRFCSYEPAIGPLRVGPRKGFPGWVCDGPETERLHWLICGGESGPGYRPFDLQWEEDIRLDCEQAGIAYFFKQMAGKKLIHEGFQIVRQFPEAR